MSQSKKKRSRARAFVVTLAVASSGCGEAETSSGNGSTTSTTAGSEPSLLGISDAVHRRGDACVVHAGMHGCPPDVMCNPPAPRPVACPPELTQNGSIVRHADGRCVLVLDPVCTFGPVPTCNPPPPQRVPCDEGAIAQGVQQRHADGHCYVFVAPDCPRPEQTCTESESRPVACPGPETPQ